MPDVFSVSSLERLQLRDQVAFILPSKIRRLADFRQSVDAVADAHTDSASRLCVAGLGPGFDLVFKDLPDCVRLRPGLRNGRPVDRRGCTKTFQGLEVIIARAMPDPISASTAGGGPFRSPRALRPNENVRYSERKRL